MPRSADSLATEVDGLRLALARTEDALTRGREACAAQARLDPDIYSRGYLLGAAEAGATILSALALQFPA